ncbi:hypothetical protein D1641_01520 [Colidextribacter sp. OB.20]|uniref:hypothetical protein n=1 Tax=Colidextribacter sp. OB.20 TaxID=2304568 RepID=UPI00136FD47D|nr:hypothetical protein [Colidextribacter sp. OB.20]NBI08699.1 hypothetical protein [Colidextribacter sp. OB.20]
MAENFEELPAQGPAQESGAPPPLASHSSRGQQRRRQRSVFQYITILFAAALVLLLYTFMMERRQFEQQQQQDKADISDLQQQSVSAVQRLEGLLTENERLKQQVQDLQADQSKLEDNISILEDQTIQLQEQLTQVSQAMDWFWQINEAYARGRNALCKELITSMEAAGLQEHLPRENTTDTDRFSPYDRYMEIRDKIIK